MQKTFEKYKGIHPGLILERELRKRKLEKASFAISINVLPQALNEITNGQLDITTALSFKIDKALELEEGTMISLQAFYEIEKEKSKLASEDRPNLSLLRKALFWDTQIETINWRKQYKAIIKRVFERGTKGEKNEIIRFYGLEKVEDTVGSDFTISTYSIHEKGNS